jgi:hypothetical protein
MNVTLIETAKSINLNFNKEFLIQGKNSNNFKTISYDIKIHKVIYKKIKWKLIIDE